MKNIAVLISGNGSNLQALIDNQGTVYRIAVVVSNRKAAYGLIRAQEVNIPTVYLSMAEYKKQCRSREDYDKDLGLKVKEFQIDLVVLAGFMHILSSQFIDIFPLTINLHPALPGQFDGIDAIQRAYQAFEREEIKETGVMIHKVIPEVDRGQVICMERVEMKRDETLYDFEQRMHNVEHRLIVEGVKMALNKLSQ